MDFNFTINEVDIIAVINELCLKTDVTEFFTVEGQDIGGKFVLSVDAHSDYFLELSQWLPKTYMRVNLETPSFPRTCVRCHIEHKGPCPFDIGIHGFASLQDREVG